jgi:hypothetical protein
MPDAMAHSQLMRKVPLCSFLRGRWQLCPKASAVIAELRSELNRPCKIGMNRCSRRTAAACAKPLRAMTPCGLLRIAGHRDVHHAGKEANSDGKTMASEPTQHLLSTVREKDNSQHSPRLNVLPIHVPGLRDRKEDIPMLLECFVKRAMRRRRESKSAKLKKRRSSYASPMIGRVTFVSCKISSRGL